MPPGHSSRKIERACHDSVAMRFIAANTQPDHDAIVRLVRFPGWQGTQAGEREVNKAVRKALFKYKLHAEEELFEKAFSYVRQYY